MDVVECIENMQYSCWIWNVRNCFGYDLIFKVKGKKYYCFYLV